MYQSLTRAMPGVQDAELFGWLRGLYPIWAGLTPEMVQVSTQVAMAELLLSGCTTSSDHLYIYPNGVRLEDSIEAAQRIGMRFVATRGSMSVGQSQGRPAARPRGGARRRHPERQPAPDRDLARRRARRHGAVALAPCSPFSVSPPDAQSAELARSFKGQGVRLHTHLAENDHDIAYSREKFNKTPAQYAQDLGWLGDDVWHAHCVKLDDEGISPVRRQPHRRGALPLQQHAPGQRHRPGAPHAGRRCAGGPGGGRQRQQRRAHMVNEARQACCWPAWAAPCKRPKQARRQRPSSAATWARPR
jgi:8-oxoguanine deaminase